MTVVAITGASGFIGQALGQALRQRGDDVRPVARDANGAFVASPLDGADVVVHLAGAPLAQGRWTAARKRTIEESRSAGTRALVDMVRELSRPPKVWVNASAIGIYGDRGDEVLTEASDVGAPGPDGAAFLARVCAGWEREALRVREAGLRVAIVRLGLVLSPGGGALKTMLPLFRAGGGGPMGNGSQFWSWVSLHDVVRAMVFAIDTQTFAGTANVVSPTPLTAGEFAQGLGKALHRPALIPAPAFALKWALGEMAQATVLASQRVIPTRLEGAGFTFAHRVLSDALAFELEAAALGA